MDIRLDEIYYKQNAEIEEYKDVYLETSIGVMRVYPAGLALASGVHLHSMHRLTEIDNLKRLYGNLHLEEVRRTYDSNMYFLISGKFILAVEYVLNSQADYSTQEFRVIEQMDGVNKTELDDFKELDIVELPSFPV